jgi:hypothetical protein
MDLEMPLEEADLVDQLHRHSKTRITTSSMSHWCHGTIIVRNFLGIFLTHLKIDKVITGVSLSVRTSTTTESIMLLNPRINLGKYEHPCQVEDLNPGVGRFHHKEPNKLS